MDCPSGWGWGQAPIKKRLKIAAFYEFKNPKIYLIILSYTVLTPIVVLTTFHTVAGEKGVN